MILYSNTERIRILTGCGISIEIVNECKTQIFTGYNKEWKLKVYHQLKSMLCPDIIILRVLEGEYDHNKAKLYAHLILFDKEHLTNKIWDIIK